MVFFQGSVNVQNTGALVDSVGRGSVSKFSSQRSNFGAVSRLYPLSAKQLHSSHSPSAFAGRLMVGLEGCNIGRVLASPGRLIT